MSTAVSPPAGTLCLGCHRALAGPYCAQCGQPASTCARITLTDLLHDIPHSIWHVDHGVLYTLRELLARPGATLRRYLAGERTRFFRPLALLLLLSGLTSFLIFALNVDLLSLAPPATDDSAQARELARRSLAINRLVFKYFGWFTIAMLPVYAGLSWRLFSRLRLHFAEHLLVNAFLLSAAVVL